MIRGKTLKLLTLLVLILFTVQLSSGFVASNSVKRQGAVLQKTDSWAPENFTLIVTNTTYSYKVTPEFYNFGNKTIYHRVRVIWDYTTTVYVSKPLSWTYDHIEPYASVSSNSTHVWFTAKEGIEYYVYFTSTDYWNYPMKENSRVVFYNQRGDVIDFDKFRTYKADMPNRLIQYAPDPNDPNLMLWWDMWIDIYYDGDVKIQYDIDKIHNVWFDFSGYGGTLDYNLTTMGYIGYAISARLESVHPSGNTWNPSGGSVNELYLSSTPLTIEFWIRLDSDVSGGTTDLIDNDYTASVTGFYVGITESEKLVLTVGLGDTDASIYSSQSLIVGRWYHVVIEFGNGQMYIYLNGKLDSSGTYSGSYAPSTIDQLWLFYFDLYGNLTLDELKFYNDFLTPKEIWWHYAIAFYYDGYQDIMGRTPELSYPTSYTSGIFGYAVHFDGNPNVRPVDGVYSGIEWSSDYASEAHFRGYTYIAVARPSDSDTSLYNLIVGQRGWHHGIYWDGGTRKFRLSALIRRDSSNSYGLADVWSDAVEPNQWYIVVASALPEDDGVRLYLMVNGELYTAYYSDKFLAGYYASENREYTIGGFADGGNYADYFEGDVDEGIFLTVPLSQDMMLQFWNFTKSYLGGYYVDNEFKATWDIEQDGLDGGFAESFADVSDWSWAYSSGHTDYSITTDGDVGLIQSTAITSGTTYLYYKKTVTSFSLTNILFVEMRFKTITNASGVWINPAIKLLEGGTEKAKRWASSDFGQIQNDTWYIWHWNAYEAAVAMGTTDFNVNTIVVGYDPANEYAGVKCELYIDWIRIYTFQGYDPLAHSHEQGEMDWISSMGGVVIFHHYFDQGGTFEATRLALDVPDGPAEYVEIRAKGEVRFSFQTDVTWYVFTKYYSDWVTLRFSIPDNQIQYIIFGINDDWNPSAYPKLPGSDESVGSLSGDAYAYFDYIRIGYVQEKIADTEFEPILQNVYQHPRNSYVWFNVTDRFGNLLVYEPRPYQEFQDFTLSVYSVKIHNQYHEFRHVNITKSGSNSYWSEWLAPYEHTEYFLMPGSYLLRIKYTNGTYIDYGLEINGDTYFLITGDTLFDIANNLQYLQSNLTNVNATIHTQLVNINVTITNWNSEINNTVINVNINLNNVNSTLYNEIINIQAAVENLQTNVTWQFANLSLNMDNNFSVIQGQIITVNNTVLNVNSTLNMVNNTIINTIIDVNSSVQHQFIHVLTNISQVKSMIREQTITLREDIAKVTPQRSSSVPGPGPGETGPTGRPYVNLNIDSGVLQLISVAAPLIAIIIASYILLFSPRGREKPKKKKTKRR